MSYEMLRNVFVVSLILGCLMLFVSVFLFFRFKIPKTLGDITGSAGRKAVKRMQGQVPRAGQAQMSVAGQAQIHRRDRKPPGVPFDAGSAITQKISTQEIAEPVAPMNSDENTSLLSLMPYEEEPFEVEHDITFVHTHEMIP